MCLSFTHAPRLQPRHPAGYSSASCFHQSASYHPSLPAQHSLTDLVPLLPSLLRPVSIHLILTALGSFPLGFNSLLHRLSSTLYSNTHIHCQSQPRTFCTTIYTAASAARCRVTSLSYINHRHHTQTQSTKTTHPSILRPFQTNRENTFESTVSQLTHTPAPSMGHLM